MMRERKFATLLFADIVGFTSIGEAYDPELVASLVSEIFEQLAQEVRHHEGTVEKFAGDAMLAVFGVPASHEDDPARAVRAALAMQAAMGSMRDSSHDGRPELELRIGIETGEVFVDLTRAATEGDLFVTGDAVNTAARLQAAADPGAVLVGEATQQATRALLELEALPTLELKGKARRVAAWRVVAQRDAGAVRRPLELGSRFVGRDAELRELKDAVQRAAADDRPHLVTIVGNAGVGKSRLVWELGQYLDGLPRTFQRRVGRCVAYGDRSLAPMADVVKADAGVADDDALEVARTKLARRLEELGVAGDERVAGPLQAVLGMGDADVRPRSELIEAWRRYVAAIARLAPLVLVVEDIHWADDGVLAMLDGLARWGEGSVAVICLARPELLEREVDWGRGVPDATTIALEPLDQAANAVLVEGLLGAGLPAELKRHVVERSEGNPLFAEETVRMLIDRGVLRRGEGVWRLARPLGEAEVPASIHAVIAARLDTLPAAQRRLLGGAAAIGRIFWDTLLAHMRGADRDEIERQLLELCDKDLIVLRDPSTLTGATEYGFRHVLIRDVAYDSLPRRERAGSHERIASFMANRSADRSEEVAELVAGHLARALGHEQAVAGSTSPELGPLRERTYAALQRAALRAASMGVVERACRWMRQAIDVAYALERPPRELAGLADVDSTFHGVTTRYPDHVDMLARVVDDLEREPGLTDADEQLVARLRSSLTGAYLGTQDVEAARTVARDGIGRLESGEPTPGRARLYRALGWTYAYADADEEAAPYLETALAEADACADLETHRWALHDLGMLRRGSDLDTAIALLERAYRLAVQADDRALQWRCRHNLAAARFERGDPLATILELSHDGLAQVRLETEGRSHWLTAWFHAYYLWEAGDLDGALTVADEALMAAVSHGGAHGAHYGLRAMIHRSRGEASAAARDDEAMEADPDGPAIDHEWSETLLERAWARWSREPGEAVANLEADVARAELHPQSKAEIAPTVARMALRLGNSAQLDRALAAYHRHEGYPPVHKVRALIEGLAAADAGVQLEGSAAELEDKGYVLAALDLWMDAALIAARAGRETDALTHARSIVARTGLHPLIGPIPETRWLEGTR